jgi:hypothetical protein
MVDRGVESGRRERGGEMLTYGVFAIEEPGEDDRGKADRPVTHFSADSDEEARLVLDQLLKNGILNLGSGPPSKAELAGTTRCARSLWRMNGKEPDECIWP